MRKLKFNRNESQKTKNPYLVGMIALAVILAVVIALVLYFVLRTPSGTVPVVDPTEPGENSSSESEITGYEEILQYAGRLAMMYDYEKAIDYVKTEAPGYEEVAVLSNFIAECQAKKAKLVKWSDNTKITHIFFHSLIKDTSIAFSSEKSSDYNEVMTTIDEFNKILDSMYRKGYVLVHLSDIAKIVKQADGSEKMVYQPIYLPSDKTPFVLSVDDLSYYDYMDGHGFASRLVINEAGKVVCEYEEKDGTLSYGDFDVVPILDSFVDSHPDFSYHNAKGTIALTGYNGILGYRTSYITYGPSDTLQAKYNELFKNNGLFDEAYAYQLALNAHTYTNDNIEADRAEAKKVADAMKENGWKFASHTWGHMDMSTVVAGGNVTSERFYRDTQWWDVEVRPLVGDTDIIIFSYGADIGSWRGYSDESSAYSYLKKDGFNYYCNVDSSKTSWVQLSQTAGGSGYLRQGRRNLDGQLMFKQLVNKDTKILYDLFDPIDVFDRARPLPVNGVKLPEGYDEGKLFSR